MSHPTALQLQRAHQWLYYVSGYPSLPWSDEQYDRFCYRHGIQGGGGSSCDASYTDEDRALAAAERVKPTDPLTLIDVPPVAELRVKLATMEEELEAWYESKEEMSAGQLKWGYVMEDEVTLLKAQIRALEGEG